MPLFRFKADSFFVPRSDLMNIVLNKLKVCCDAFRSHDDILGHEVAPGDRYGIARVWDEGERGIHTIICSHGRGYG